MIINRYINLKVFKNFYKLPTHYFLKNLSISNTMYKTEVEKAQEASNQKNHEKSIFQKIINREIPADIIFEDDKCIAITDINPVTKVHFLVIPKAPIPQLSAAHDSDAELLGHLMITAKNLAKDKNLKEGYRVVINNGKHGCQSVYHLHIHVLGGEQLGWPPC